MSEIRESKCPKIGVANVPKWGGANVPRANVTQPNHQCLMKIDIVADGGVANTF